jgi:predicted restriction endonuclease
LFNNIAVYLQQFASLKRSPGGVWGEATKKRAPHKPILLLAVLDLAARGGITSPFIDVSGDLAELNELFNLYWRRVVHLGQTSSIAFPFSNLDREPFWHLVSREDQGFRRVVVKAYEHRCALGGVWIITPEGHTVVDAAHIVPWRQSHNDEIRNGLALCKLCHWSFDHGMMGVSDAFAIIVPERVAATPNAPGFLTTLAGRPIIPPTDPDLRPAPENFAAHRREWRL